MGITFNCRVYTRSSQIYITNIYIYLYIFLSSFKSITNKCTFQNIILYQSYNHSTKSLALYEKKKQKTYHIIHLYNDHLSLCLITEHYICSQNKIHERHEDNVKLYECWTDFIFPVLLTLILKYIFLLILNISVSSWRLVLLVEETVVPEKTTDLLQVTDCIGSSKSNYHMITMAPPFEVI